MLNKQTLALPLQSTMHVSGVFNYAQEDIFKNSIKPSFKLTKLTTIGEPSIKTVCIYLIIY